MKRLLIVTPRFAPCGGADSRRAEQLAPRLEALGWQVEVLAAHCDLAPGSDAVRIHRIARPMMTLPGWRSPGMRSLRAFDLLASELHARDPFDLVLFSNTDFATWRLGPRWWRKLRLPFVLDWQDPWFTTYYDEHPSVVPPGGRLKFAVANGLARRWEAAVAPEADGHLFVSDAYDAMLLARYPCVAKKPRSVIPIAFEPAMSTRNVPSWKPAGAGSRYWAAVGRGGPDMAVAANLFFRELAAARRSAPAQFEGLEVWFVGTDYAPPARARRTIAPIAADYGLADCVFELPVRVPETDARGFQRDAEALVVLGSDDPGYMPSKLFGDLATGKPIVAAFGANCTAKRVVATVAGVIDLSDAGDGSALARAAMAWRECLSYPRQLDEWGPDAMTGRVASLLDRAIAQALSRNNAATGGKTAS